MADRMKEKPREKLLITEADSTRYRQWAEARARRETYEPFIRARSTLSMGRKHYFFCPVLKRHVKLLSDGELLAYKHLIWQPGVINIEEQYALNPVRTFEIATEDRVIHPYSYKLNIHHIMTTDFLVTSLNSEGIPVKLAYSYKPIFDPDKPSRTRQKLEIERKYFKKENIGYRVLTSENVTKAWFMTLRFCEMHYDESIPLKYLSEFSGELEVQHVQNPWQPLRVLLARVSKLLSISLRSSECYFKNSVLSGYLRPDRTTQVRLNKPLQLEGQLLMEFEELPYAV